MIIGILITGAVIAGTAFYLGYKTGEAHEYDRERIKQIENIERQMQIMREAFMGIKK